MYIPPSQYKKGFYSNGDRFLPSGDPYVGPYFRLLNGKEYTGEIPSNTSTLLGNINNSSTKLNSSDLYKFSQPKIYIESFNQSSAENPYLRQIPPQFSPLPLPLNYPDKTITRYFVKKSKELIYYETDENFYKGISSRKNEYAWDLFDTAKISWLVKGDKSKVYKSNEFQVFKIESAKSQKNLQGKNWEGFSQYFKNNFTKYYLGS